YHVDSTGRRPLDDVKRCRIGLMLRWRTAWEDLLLFL
ncbi:unnamed protein product, partial [Sphacelaria rigidula]